MSIINDLNIDAIQNITKKATLTVINVGLPVHNPMIYAGVFGVHVRSFSFNNARCIFIGGAWQRHLLHLDSQSLPSVCWYYDNVH